MTIRKTGCTHRIGLPAAWLLAVLLIPVLTPSVYAQAPGDKDVLRVCADPYMLPFSNKQGEGYENKIAELFAGKMDASLEYKYFPQRMGFIRNTLTKEVSHGKYACDLVISVPENFELAATTKPYYTSTYVLAYHKWPGMEQVSTPEEFAAAAKKYDKFKMGVTDRGPAQLWVFKHDLMGNMVPYQGQPGDPKHDPGEMQMKDIAAGKIDAAIVWGPSGGYYAKKLHDQADITLLQMKNDPKNPEMRFEYSIAMAVRYGDKAWLAKVQQLINDNKDQINTILNDYNIPLLPLKESSKSGDDD